jgi:adenosine deaminase
MITADIIRQMPKVLLHEHLDCSLRTSTMLRLWEKRGFDSGESDFPKTVLMLWQKGEREAAADAFQDYLAAEASRSLTGYINAINHFVVPLLQTEENIRLVTQERIADAVADGVSAMELRYAPQLSTIEGLSLAKVMDAIVEGVESSPIPVNLTLCCLRHENGQVAKSLADIALSYKQVTAFDLAADESAFPGVLDWWLKEADRVREHGITPTIHLGETNSVSDADIQKLIDHKIGRIGHGIRILENQDEGNYCFEVCPTSNVTTGQVKDLSQHPVNRHLQEGRRVALSTDGTLFNKTNLTNEYWKMHQTFAWGMPEFQKILGNAIDASTFDQNEKQRLHKAVTEFCSVTK